MKKVNTGATLSLTESAIRVALSALRAEARAIKHNLRIRNYRTPTTEANAWARWRDAREVIRGLKQLIAEGH